MTHPQDWIEFFGLFTSHGVRFLIVGAHALAVHGRPRATQAIDVWVEPTPENAARVCAALVEFGFAALGDATGAFATPERMVTLGPPPLRIDVMTSIRGVDFATAWEDRVETDFGPTRVCVIGRTTLVANKLPSGRTKDRLDVELLTEGEPP